MVYTFNGKELGSFFALSSDYANQRDEFKEYDNLINIHWNRNDLPITLSIDDVEHVLLPNQLTTSTYLQKLSFKKGEPPLTSFSFNREFYCIIDHDQEVSCNGVIFFGAFDIPKVTLEGDEIDKFEALYQVFLEEFKTRDSIQGEMLMMMLKRLIIKTTRLTKEQKIGQRLDDSQVDIVRKYNVLVDIHFKTKHQVNEYAEMLFKSPKTLSNLFAKYNHKTPLQIIHERIALEGKRQLLYTDKTAKEIAHDLGFDDAGSFHKLFKKITGHTPNDFKKSARFITA
ncbi:helix-turn-helix domain-containing protein [Fulvivirga sp.]|uniref:helix-turn-helix domain-containing protein n=1 Tax=Fulvivirga sp. TaxID=1931237 RepID=UPI0032F040C3